MTCNAALAFNHKPIHVDLCCNVTSTLVWSEDISVTLNHPTMSVRLLKMKGTRMSILSCKSGRCLDRTSYFHSVVSSRGS